MPKAIVIEDEQLEYTVRVAKVSSPENGVRDAALLLNCFGTGMTVTEICRLRVSNYLSESGAVLIGSQVRAEIAYNHRSGPLCRISKKPTSPINVHLAECLARGHGVSIRLMAFWSLDPDWPFFLSGRNGEGLKISAQCQDGKTYYSVKQLSWSYTRLFGFVGLRGTARSQDGGRSQ